MLNVKRHIAPQQKPRKDISQQDGPSGTITYAFGRVWKLGALPWHQNEVTDGWVGNPLVSDIVSTYMLSLCHQKVVGWGITLSCPSSKHLFRFKQVKLQQVLVPSHQ
jgi:hypothetical protein